MFGIKHFCAWRKMSKNLLIGFLRTGAIEKVGIQFRFLRTSLLWKKTNKLKTHKTKTKQDKTWIVGTCIMPRETRMGLNCLYHVNNFDMLFENSSMKVSFTQSKNSGVEIWYYNNNFMNWRKFEFDSQLYLTPFSGMY